MSNHLLGIMTRHIGHPSRFRRHVQAALSAGFSGVLLFVPQGVRLRQRTIAGYKYASGRWTRCVSPYPSAAIDIGYYNTRETVTQAIRVKEQTPIRFTGHASGNKWTIQQHLLASDKIALCLLPSKPMRFTADAFAFAREYGAIMIKPINGKGGKGIIKLNREDGGWTMHRNKRPIVHGSETKVRAALRAATRGGAYLLQKWIDIRNPQGRVFDIRSLVQKDGSGVWTLTGNAVREGPPRSITSNICGGGRACETRPYLEKLFEADKVNELMEQLHELSLFIPAHLETDYGKCFTEFGLDFAVDRSGSLWLLEANIKPGKSVIRRLYGANAALRSFRLPYHHARYVALHGNKPKRSSAKTTLPVKDEDDHETIPKESGSAQVSEPRQ